jgi:hypothetical protein
MPDDNIKEFKKPEKPKPEVDWLTDAMNAVADSCAERGIDPSELYDDGTGWIKPVENVVGSDKWPRASDKPEEK